MNEAASMPSEPGSPARFRGTSAKIAVLGGSSAFLPGLSIALAESAKLLPPLEIHLHGRNLSRLEIMARWCNRFARARSLPQDYLYTDSIKEAVRGARVVVNQIRAGGWSGRIHDDTFPLTQGIPGDETIGPGGLASAIRGLPVTVEAALETAAAAPAAWFIQMGNPLGILLAGLHAIEGLKSFGLCEVPALTLAESAKLLGCDPGELEPDYLALNHQGWFVRLAREGIDQLATLFDRIEGQRRLDFFRVDPKTMRRIGALPLPYMRLYYHKEREAADQKAGKSSRGEILKDLSQRLFEYYEETGIPDPPGLLQQRKLAWFELALVPAISALLGGGRRMLYLSQINGPDLPGLPASAIVEKRGYLNEKGFEFIPFRGPPPLSGGRLEPSLEFLRNIIRFEEAALQAAIEPSMENVVHALILHPLVPSDAAARALAPQVLKPLDDS